jgi:nucleoside-diphosphate-sugar epimerase
MVAERVLLSYTDRLAVQIIRPATVCGYSPRMRFDVSVNMLTMQALLRGEVTVFGGDQTRPNIHIEDIADVYLHFLARPELTGVYNAGFENITIREIADRVTRQVAARITVTSSADPRSYRLNSDKLLATGFRPRRTVDDAIGELVRLHAQGALHDEDRFHNLRWMQRNAVA